MRQQNLSGNFLQRENCKEKVFSNGNTILLLYINEKNSKSKIRQSKYEYNFF